MTKKELGTELLLRCKKGYKKYNGETDPLNTSDLLVPQDE
jgi:hypothetical protein